MHPLIEREQGAVCRDRERHHDQDHRRRHPHIVQADAVDDEKAEATLRSEHFAYENTEQGERKT